jgi:hypothetical protein
MSSESKQRVQFRAPDGLSERVDALVTVFETDRTDILISVLRDYFRDVSPDDDIKQEIAGAYYDDEITFDQLKDLVGYEEAANFRVLKQQLSEEFITEAAEKLSDP